MGGRGVDGDAVRIRWPELMRFKRSFTDPVPASRERSLTEAGIAPFHGRGRFVGRATIQVGGDVLEARHVVIASGAQPVDLGIPGREHVITSDQFLELEALPSRILFIGGGYISFEFAHVAARAGAAPTILHRGSRPLAGFDPDLVDRLVERSREVGIDVRTGCDVEGIDRIAQGFRVRVRGGATHEADLVVHGAGRVPEIDDLDLARAGVEREGRGVKVNEHLQSVSNPAVYAAGDAAAGGPPLTPVASYEGKIVAANLLEGNRLTASYEVVPSVVFTVPPLATVGLQEQAARERGLRFRTNHESTSGWYSSRRVGETHSAFKVLVEEGTERILGAHLLGLHADEVINLFALAMRVRLPTSSLKEAIFAYPTSGSDVGYML
jgi:glutathione reductase (NADPH)